MCLSPMTEATQSGRTSKLDRRSGAGTKASRIGSRSRRSPLGGVGHLGAVPRPQREGRSRCPHRLEAEAGRSATVPASRAQRPVRRYLWQGLCVVDGQLLRLVAARGATIHTPTKHKEWPREAVALAAAPAKGVGPRAQGRRKAVGARAGHGARVPIATAPDCLRRSLMSPTERPRRSSRHRSVCGGGGDVKRLFQRFGAALQLSVGACQLAIVANL
eukprot:scaffold1411_cov252-Pinguiococcus_pyrenoidosus.AAC.10